MVVVIGSRGARRGVLQDLLMPFLAIWGMVLLRVGSGIPD